MIQIGNDKVVRVLQGTNTLFDTYAGWQQLEVGEGVTGTILSKINEDGTTIDLFGLLHCPKDCGGAIIKSNSTFDFALASDLTISMNRDGLNEGIVESIDLGCSNGDIGLFGKIFNYSYVLRFTSAYNPLTVPIILK